MKSDDDAVSQKHRSNIYQPMEQLRCYKGKTVGSAIYHNDGYIYGFLVLGKSRPSKEDWAGHCVVQKELVRYAIANNISVDRIGLLVICSLGIPSPMQRAAGAAVMKGFERPKLSVVSESALVRGITAAFGWLIPGDHRPEVFNLEQLREALIYIGIDSRFWWAGSQLQELAKDMLITPDIAYTVKTFAKAGNRP